MEQLSHHPVAIISGQNLTVGVHDDFLTLAHCGILMLVHVHEALGRAGRIVVAVRILPPLQMRSALIK